MAVKKYPYKYKNTDYRPLPTALISYQRDLQVPFNTPREAEIACGTLSVDPEPKRGGCKKTIVVKETVLHVHMEAEEAKSLRVGMNSFFDHLNLVVKTIEQFGPPRPVDSS